MAHRKGRRQRGSGLPVAQDPPGSRVATWLHHSLTKPLAASLLHDYPHHGVSGLVKILLLARPHNVGSDFRDVLRHHRDGDGESHRCSQFVSHGLRLLPTHSPTGQGPLTLARGGSVDFGAQVACVELSAMGDHLLISASCFATSCAACGCEGTSSGFLAIRKPLPRIRLSMVRRAPRSATISGQLTIRTRSLALRCFGAKIAQ